MLTLAIRLFAGEFNSAHAFGLIALLLVSPGLMAQVPTSRPTTAPTTSRHANGSLLAADSMDRYYLRTCAACGGMLGAKGDAVALSHEGRAVRVCCDDCRIAFERDRAGGIAKLDAIMIVDQSPHYPIQVSLIDERPLGPNPIDFVWGNRLFRAVDARDREKILADPENAIRKLNRAVLAAQTPKYGMPSKCPVQGDILPTDQVIDIVIANRMVRVCCGKCAKTVRERPSQYLDMVDYANRQAAQRANAEPSDKP